MFVMHHCKKRKITKHMKAKFLMLIFILSFFLTHGQTNYYVSPSGNNSNTGSLLLPWQTVQFGLNQLSVGDTLNLLTGIYNEKIQIPINGICIRSYIGSSPIIDATGINTQDAIISINNKSNIIIDGIELRNNIQNDAIGILVDGIASNITIKNCTIHDIHFSSNPAAPVNASTNAQGIIVYGTNSTTAITNLKILDNHLYNCRLGFSEGIAINGNVENFEISGNLVHDLTNIGIDIIGHEGTSPNPINDQARNGSVKNNTIYNCLSPYATSGGIYIDGGKNIVVENNVSYHNGYGIEIGCENIGKTTDSITVRNNIFYDNEMSALAFGGFDYPSGSGKVINSSFRNNTCYFNGFSNSAFGELYLSYSENSIIENNIFYTSNQNILVYAELSQPSLLFDYNVFYCQSGMTNLYFDWNGNSYTGFSNFVSGSGTNSNSVFGNPAFVLPSTSTPDFHITASSVALNSGNPAFVPAVNEKDIDNENRANGVVDCGADEYYLTLGFGDYSVTNKLLIYPNPTSDLLFIKNTSDNSNIEIINDLGQIIFKKNLSTNDVIDVSDFANGVYIIAINSHNSRFYTKIIKH